MVVDLVNITETQAQSFVAAQAKPCNDANNQLYNIGFILFFDYVVKDTVNSYSERQDSLIGECRLHAVCSFSWA